MSGWADDLGHDAAEEADQVVRSWGRLRAVESDDDAQLARQQAAEAAYHGAIRWASTHEGTPARRRALVREAYTSPEVAALCARDMGYASGVADAEARLALLGARRSAQQEARVWMVLALAAFPTMACLVLVLGVIVRGWT